MRWIVSGVGMVWVLILGLALRVYQGIASRVGPWLLVCGLGRLGIEWWSSGLGGSWSGLGYALAGLGLFASQYALLWVCLMLCPASRRAQLFRWGGGLPG